MSTGRIQTLLIANRGEIAVRIIQSARKMGIRTVAVFAEADKHSQHVALADTRVCLGEGPVNQTYLVKEKILDAAKRSGADAIHPGYGFLSEDAVFAQQVVDAGVRWVGPPVSAMKSMASKASAKQTLEPKGVPMIPGYHGDEQSTDVLMEKSKSVGYPLLVKASAGGGGKGMKVVNEESELFDAIESARREAKNSFGDDRLLLEKYLLKPRHVEVQILADEHGKVMSLFERDCSVQRRHQKVLEEAPAPHLPENIRQAMWLAAETAAREIGYVGAGTVEFILSADGAFFFLEMNTRLQVEHPVTEFITGLDLVAWQLKVAAGEHLDITLPESPMGHAIEVRLYAEDPFNNFQPMVGHIDHLQFPQGEGVRIDSGVVAGDNVSPFYDPMLAKVIVHGENRAAALAKLSRVLAETRCIGLTTNLEFLRRLTNETALHDMTIHTRWLDDQQTLLTKAETSSLPFWAALGSVMSAQETQPNSSWQRHAGWRLDGRSQWQFSISEADQVVLTRTTEQWQGTLFDKKINVHDVQWRSESKSNGLLLAQADGMSVEWDVYTVGDGVWLDNGDRIEQIQWWRAEKAHDHDRDVIGAVSAVLPGTVTAVYAKAGAQINVGDKLISFEAMKMETTLVAEIEGTLESLDWSAGDQIAEGDLLYSINADPAEDQADQAEQEAQS